VFSLGLTCSVRAEVGMLLDHRANEPARGPYLFSIIDDSDPVVGVWATVSRDHPHRVPLNPEGDVHGDGPPSVLTDRDSGSTLVAWARGSEAGFDVVLSRFENGEWGEAELLAGTPADELDPQLVAGPAGEIHLLYGFDDGLSRTILHRQTLSHQDSWSAPVPVSRAGELASRPSGVFFDGSLHVTYEVDTGDGGPREVVLARKEAGSFIVEVLASSYNTGALWPRAHSRSGRFWVDWIDGAAADVTHGEMAWLRRSATGVWEVIRYEPFDGEEEREFHVRGRILYDALTLP
jgi:hypothetical protein